MVLLGNLNAANNYVELNGYKWNLTQLLAHEMMHCFQYKDLGFRKSNPVAGIPSWKWEGYPEYIARQNEDQVNLLKNIDHLIATEKTDHNGWINFADETGTVIEYYKSWLLVKYCLDIKKQSWNQLLNDKTSDAAIHAEMMHWYQLQKR
ncbi:MAG: hypothetical protein EOO03_03515 [Chitinophagaceae bacterium]|nr:MAG: hypothetical protein EOO03_03515 [Chitinophagaceae bacterium]